MKNSVCTAGLSHVGVPIVLLISSPSSSAKMTYSMPQFDEQAVAGEQAREPGEREDRPASRPGTAATRHPTSAMPIAPTIRNPMPT